jgi:[acyl-carrier-protein] S-malonyltransferase
VVANVTTQAITDPNAIRSCLVKQVTGQVRWRESVEKMAADGVDTMVEIGAGKVLCGLVRRINREIACQNIGTPADIEAFLAR